MKQLVVIGYTLFSICFFPFCSSLAKQEGTIARQVSLVEDLENKLPESERPRFRKFLNNIQKEEVLSDRTIKETSKEAKEAHSVALEKSEDAGKWFGLRNLFIGAVIAFLLFVGFKVGTEILKRRALPV